MALLGIDGGQTATKACLYDPTCGVCVIAEGPPIDHMLTLNGQVKSRQGIQLALRALLAKTKMAETVEMAFVSISGVHKEHEDMIKSWITECVHVDRIVVEGDVKANLAGASAGKNDGVLVIAGGGSIGYYSDGENEFVAGGYGHILGDEGSAYWIGLQAIKAGIRHSEGRGMPTVLHERTLQYFGELSYWGIKKRIHADKIGRDEIASVARLVHQSADEGDEAARQILRQAGNELGELAVSVLKQIKEKGGVKNVRIVYPTGGVFQSKRWVLDSMAETIQRYDASVEIRRPLYPPVIGAIFLAACELNRTIDEEKLNQAIGGTP
jgi:Predicted N-acetylglucosamine kinase